MRNHTLALGMAQTGCRQFFIRRPIHVDAFTVATPSFSHALGNRLRIALQFGGSLSGLLPQLVGVLGMIRSASYESTSYEGETEAESNACAPILRTVSSNGRHNSFLPSM
jgi:hypothetical protein